MMGTYHLQFIHPKLQKKMNQMLEMQKMMVKVIKIECSFLICFHALILSELGYFELCFAFELCRGFKMCFERLIN
jgi:hypothetical protein